MHMYVHIYICVLHIYIYIYIHTHNIYIYIYIMESPLAAHEDGAPEVVVAFVVADASAVNIT